MYLTAEGIVVNFSSIIKTGDKKNRPQEKEAPQKEQERHRKWPALLQTALPEEKTEPAPQVEVACDSQEPLVAPEDIYQKVVDFLQGVVERLAQNRSIAYKEISEKVELLLNELNRNNRLFSTLIVPETPDLYIIGHQVNVCILALKIGVRMGYGHDKLVELGCGALLFDCGMLKVLDIVKQKRGLVEDELEEVRRHPEYGLQMLKQLTDLPQSVTEIALQHHERTDGKGYPYGLHGKEISVLSKIVSLADIYIAMIQPRPNRKGFSPHHAIKELLRHAHLFGAAVLRGLLNAVSIYPVGTLVEVNSRVIGRVIKLNHENILRPTIELIRDCDNQPLEKKTLLDLADSPLLCITDVVDDEDVEKQGEVA